MNSKLDFVFGTEEEYSKGLSEIIFQGTGFTTNNKTLEDCKIKHSSVVFNKTENIGKTYLNYFFSAEELYHGGLHKWQSQNLQANQPFSI